MNSNFDNELEGWIDRELKSLPPLAAPSTLSARVMAVITARAAAPWYRRAWPTWPVALQAASFAVLLALFGGLCFGGWQLSQAASVSAAAQVVGSVLSLAGAAWRTLGVLGDAGMQVIQHLGTGFICGLVVMALAGYALLLGLGSACYRLAYARR